MKSFKNTQPGSSSLFGDENLFALRPGVRVKARGFLCSASDVLTEREKTVLHCLAQGVAARDIARSNQPSQPSPPAA